jgi:hypothetical protein
MAILNMILATKIYCIRDRSFFTWEGGLVEIGRRWATQNKWPKKGGLCQNFCEGGGGSRENINFCFF